MVSEELLPFLRERVHPGFLKIIKLRTTGIIESALAEKISALTVKLPESLRLAYLPSYGGVDLRIVSFGATREMADSPAENLARQLRESIGAYIYGEGDDTLEGVIGNLLKERKETLATAESCTAGLLAGQITSIAGSSAYFERGVVTYSNRSKIELLGVTESLIEKHGAVSQETAEAMAAGIREKAGVNYGASITGIAGPDGGTVEKPVGTVFIATSSAERVRSRKLSLGKDRNISRRRSVYAALELIRRTILRID